MKWYYAEDISYYVEKVAGNGLLVSPSEEELLKSLRSGELKDVIAPYLPPERFKFLFTLVELPNRHAPFTTQELKWINAHKSEKTREKLRNKILERKLGLKIHTLLEDIVLIGLDNVRRYVSAVKEVKEEKLKPKGVFLVGVPGTGKSYSAKYCAKVLNAYLVEFNVSKILESPNPIFTLHNVFNFLSTLDRPVVLWIDEIEKAFTGQETEKRIFGQLLTVLSDLNTPTGYKINGLVWATANDITGIMQRNPEFLRRGRFDELFFVDNPKLENAKKLAEYYRRYYGFEYENFGEALLRVVRELVYVHESNVSGSAQADRFLYTPAEVQQVAKQMAIRKKLKEVKVDLELLYPKELTYSYNIMPNPKTLDEGDLIVVVHQIKPISVSMQEAIDAMRGQAEHFTPAD